MDPSIGTDVVVRGIDDDDATLVALLDELLSGGGCACVLRNTVARAQGTYGELKRAFGDSCVKLVHSRFIATDRMANDAELLRLLGPDSSGRPGKLIVVGTQVIEQSLDIDFDVMVTDIAPVDFDASENRTPTSASAWRGPIAPSRKAKVGVLLRCWC